MENLKERIEELQHYDPCAHVPPLFFAQLLEALRVMADATELNNFKSADSYLPKLAGAFVYQGYPCHMRSIEHNNNMYIIFCSYHNGTSGASGCNYILYKKDETGNFKFTTIYTSLTVVEWVRRCFGEAPATATYPGIVSALMYKRMEAVYNWCVSQGMPAVN